MLPPVRDPLCSSRFVDSSHQQVQVPCVEVVPDARHYNGVALEAGNHLLLQVGGVCIPGYKVEMEFILTLLLEFSQLVDASVAFYDQPIEIVFLLCGDFVVPYSLLKRRYLRAQ